MARVLRHGRASILLAHSAHARSARKNRLSLVKCVCFETTSDVLKSMISRSSVWLLEDQESGWGARGLAASSVEAPKRFRFLNAE